MEERLLSLLRLAIRCGATDIHFRVRYNEMSIEMRVDGINKPIKSKRGDEKMMRYLQYLAKLDMGKQLDPRTGQFEMDVDGTILSLRFAIINEVSVTDGVLRILNPTINIDSSHLSTIKDQNNYFKSLLNKDYGLIVFSGPTGSGKTTTLYTLLKSLKRKKIYTIEDPIEVYSDNLVQLQVNEEAGFDYEEGVKQIMRHDPDIIMIGEIRDSKAAKMAIRAANSGHLVLTTIHSSTSSSVISKFTDFGANERYLYEMLLCISNQRMMIGKNNEKIVLYEVMDKEEIDYFKEHNKNSNNFLSVDKQTQRGKSSGLFKEAY